MGYLSSAKDSAEKLLSNAKKTTVKIFKDSYDRFIFVLILSSLLISVLTIADAMKSTIEIYSPKTSSKLAWKYMLGIIFIVISVVLYMVFSDKID